MDYVWLFFFIIIGFLQFVGWVMRQLQGPQGQRPPQPGQRGPQRGPQPRGPNAGGQPRGETPFQAVLRMLEEAAEAQDPEAQRRKAQQQRREAQLQRQQQAQARPRPRPQPQGEVLRARKPERSRGVQQSVIGERHLQTSVAGRSLEKKVADRHLRSAVADRHLTSLGAGDDRAIERAARDVKIERPFWERLEEDYTAAQRAIILNEVIGPPRAAHLLRRGARRLG